MDRLPNRLVVRAPNWIGDAVLSLGALRDVRRAFPAARLTVLARPWVAGLYGAVREVDAVVPSRGVRADAALLRGQYDAAILFPNSFATALAPFLAGTEERWGYATDGRSLMLTRSARVPRELRGRSQVYYYRAMLAGIGLRVSATPDVSLACPAPWAEQGARLLEGGGDWIGVNPGAFYGTAKRWLPERYAEAADTVARERGARVVILGGPGERALGETIVSSMKTPAENLCGRTSLEELVGVVSRLSLLLTNDSGVMHVAAALGIPLVAIFGPTDWRETAPVSPRSVLVREPVDCAPCLLRECPIDHRCMTRVTVDRVVGSARGLARPA